MLKGKPATCHPDRIHYAFGLCQECYHKQRSASGVSQRLNHQWYLSHRVETLAAQKQQRMNRTDEERERDFAYDRQYRAGHLEESSLKGKVYRTEHKEQIRRSWRCWYDAHSVHNREQVKRWNTEHPERVRAYRAQHKALRQGAFVAPVDVGEIYRRDRGKCGICGRVVAPKDITLDHILPLVRGGTHEPANVRLAHHLCNISRKHYGSAQLRLIG